MSAASGFLAASASGVAPQPRNAEMGATQTGRNMILDLDRRDDLGATLRDLIEAGAPDQPVTVRYDGTPCLEIRSLHRAALLAVTENPSPRHVDYTPHPRAKTGPIVAALLEARTTDRRLRREYGC